MKKFLGIMLGLMAIGLSVVYFLQTRAEGESNWQYPVLAFGMAFILYFTIVKPKPRK